MSEYDSFGLEDKLDLTLSSKGMFFLNGPITVENCSLAIKWIISENLSIKKQKVLTLYINSEGGDLYQAFALIDTMKASTHIIRTVGLGQVMSAAFLIFAAGSKGHREIGRYTSLMCHQYSSELGNVKHHDLQSAVAEGNICDAKMLNILMLATGMTRTEVQDRLLNATDKYLDAEAAVELRIADSILEKYA